jgi:histidine ammonia-lyase
LGKGEVWEQNRIVPTEKVLKEKDVAPMRLSSKEGLALLNGTQFSLAYACHIVTEGLGLLQLANRVAALSMDAYNCDVAPLHSLIHQVRPHAGQRQVAEEILTLLSDSEMRRIPRSSVQDPYSFRCVPQVHGASFQALSHARDVVNTEINSVTDNPLVFHEGNCILSGGNFHAQPLALALDYICIALAELGNISERRIYQLINGDRGLPVYLTKEAGLNSGFMIAQYTAASIVSQNKQYCMPASVDSIVSSKGQEDHVSMAANAATKAWKVLENLKNILAVEWLVAAQALEFRRPAKSAAEVEKLVEQLRAKVPFLENDRFMHADLSATVSLVETWLEEQL